jgi:serine/threonine-protein kinase RsbW
MQTIRVSFNSDPAIWAHVRLMLRGILEMQLIPARDTNLITLGVDEVFTNIMRHAYGGHRNGAIELEVSCRDKRLYVTFRDFGKKVPIEKIRPRDLSDIQPGGLGVHIINTVFDSVKYDDSLAEGTILRLEKDLTKPVLGGNSSSKDSPSIPQEGSEFHG